MRFIAFIVIIGAIIFFTPKTYLTYPGKVSKSEYQFFIQHQKKCIGLQLKIEINGKNGEKKALCAGWLSEKDYVDILDTLTQ